MQTPSITSHNKFRINTKTLSCPTKTILVPIKIYLRTNRVWLSSKSAERPVFLPLTKHKPNKKTHYLDPKETKFQVKLKTYNHLVSILSRSVDRVIIIIHKPPKVHLCGSNLLVHRSNPMKTEGRRQVHSRQLSLANLFLLRENTLNRFTLKINPFRRTSLSALPPRSTNPNFFWCKIMFSRPNQWSTMALPQTTSL